MKTIQTKGITHSALGLGTAAFNSDISQRDAFLLMDDYFLMGGTLLDTAAVYANWVAGAERSASEKCIGRYLKAARPDRAVVSTKGAHYDLSEPEKSRVRPEIILSDCARSAENLMIDTIDIYFLHRDDASYPVGEIMDALFSLQDRGWVRAIGASNWTLSRLMRAADYAKAKGRRGFDAVQQQYAFLRSAYEQDRTLVQFDEKTDAGFCADEGLSVFAYTSQMRGYISKIRSGTANEALQKKYATKENGGKLERAKAVARELGALPENVALAYLLHRPYPVCALLGSKTRQQLAESMRGGQIALSPDQIQFLSGE